MSLEGCLDLSIRQQLPNVALLLPSAPSIRLCAW